MDFTVLRDQGILGTRIDEKATSTNRIGDVASFIEIGDIKILCPKAEDFVNVRKSIT